MSIDMIVQCVQSFLGVFFWGGRGFVFQKVEDDFKAYHGHCQDLI